MVCGGGDVGEESMCGLSECVFCAVSLFHWLTGPIMGSLLNSRAWHRHHLRLPPVMRHVGKTPTGWAMLPNASVNMLVASVIKVGARSTGRKRDPSSPQYQPHTSPKSGSPSTNKALTEASEAEDKSAIIVEDSPL